jgi:hypothetical protein
MIALEGCAHQGIESAGPRPNPIPVAGAENLTWSLLVLSWHKPESYQYLAYVDGIRMPLSSVTCERADATTYTCVAPLPPLKPGRHEIRLATIDTQSGSESTKSGPIVVAVTLEKPPNR